MDIFQRYAISNGLSDVSETIQAYTEKLVEFMESSEIHSSGGSAALPSEVDASRAFNLFGSSLSSENQRKVALRAELVKYQHQTLTYKDGTDVMAWIRDQNRVCPNVVRVALCLFSVPGSQAENERVFSLAGILSKQRRSNISVNRLDEYINIYANLRNEFSDVTTQASEKHFCTETAIARTIDEEIYAAVGSETCSEVDNDDGSELSD